MCIRDRRAGISALIARPPEFSYHGKVISGHGPEPKLEWLAASLTRRRNTRAALPKTARKDARATTAASALPRTTSRLVARRSIAYFLVVRAALCTALPRRLHRIIPRKPRRMLWDEFCFATTQPLPDAELEKLQAEEAAARRRCLLYTSPSPRDRQKPRMPSSA